MSDSSFGLRIGPEGEREFKRAIADITAPCEYWVLNSSY